MFYYLKKYFDLIISKIDDPYLSDVEKESFIKQQQRAALLLDRLKDVNQKVLLYVQINVYLRTNSGREVPIEFPTKDSVPEVKSQNNILNQIVKKYQEPLNSVREIAEEFKRNQQNGRVPDGAWGECSMDCGEVAADCCMALMDAGKKTRRRRRRKFKKSVRKNKGKKKR